MSPCWAFPRRLRTDPIAEGKRLAAEHDTALSADPFARQRRRTRRPNPTRIRTTGSRFNRGSRRRLRHIQRAMHAVRAGPRAGRSGRSFPPIAVLIDRYESARRMPGFAAVPIADHGRAAIERSNLGRVHAMLLTWLRWTRNRATQPRLAASSRPTARSGGAMLSGAGTLGDKLSAFRALGEDVRLASELIASPVFDAASCGPALRTLLAPMTAREASLADAFRMASCRRCACSRAGPIRQSASSPSPGPIAI